MHYSPVYFNRTHEGASRVVRGVLWGRGPLGGDAVPLD